VALARQHERKVRLQQEQQQPQPCRSRVQPAELQLVVVPHSSSSTDTRAIAPQSASSSSSIRKSTSSTFLTTINPLSTISPFSKAVSAPFDEWLQRYGNQLAQLLRQRLMADSVRRQRLFQNNELMGEKSWSTLMIGTTYLTPRGASPASLSATPVPTRPPPVVQSTPRA